MRVWERLRGSGVPAASSCLGVRHLELKPQGRIKSSRRGRRSHRSPLKPAPAKLLAVRGNQRRPGLPCRFGIDMDQAAGQGGAGAHFHHFVMHVAQHLGLGRQFDSL